MTDMESSKSFYKQSVPEIDLKSDSWIRSLDPRIRGALESLLKFGTVFLVYRMAMFYLVDKSSADTSLFDKASAQLVAYILIGFVFYYLLIKPYVPLHLEHPILRGVLDDTIMFGSVLLVSHVLDVSLSNSNFMDETWLKNAAFIIVAFAVYRIIVFPFIPFDRINQNIVPLMSDCIQFGVFLLAFRLLRGESINQKWILSVLFVLTGFAVYHAGIKRLI